MEEVRVGLPESVGGGELKALRLQDLPAVHVIAFMSQPPGSKEFMGMKLLALAAGSDGEALLGDLTFGEVAHLMDEWLVKSAESEETDTDGTGNGIDWSSLLL